MTHCTDCPSLSRCTSCEKGYFPNWRQTSCMKPFLDCNVTKPELYINDGVDYVCPVCNDGFYWDSNE